MNNMEPKTRAFCEVDVQEFHLCACHPPLSRLCSPYFLYIFPLLNFIVFSSCFILSDSDEKVCLPSPAQTFQWILGFESRHCKGAVKTHFHGKKYKKHSSAISPSPFFSRSSPPPPRPRHSFPFEKLLLKEKETGGTCGICPVAVSHCLFQGQSLFLF